MTVTPATRRSIAESTEGMPWSDRNDFADARRGLLGRSEDRQIKAADGRVVWDLDAYRFLDADCSDTAHPSLWRQGQLLINDGLFEVVPGIYQVRGYDLSVVSFLETDNGVIVVDPLISTETAAAALALYRRHRGERPVMAVIYTHSHADHFGGVKGVTSNEDVAAGRVQIIAPEGFTEHAVAENVFAGPAMTRRAGYMYGAALAKDPAGQIGSGLGQTTSTGEVSLIPPTVSIGHTGERIVVDGLTLEFQITPGTEAPAEMNFYLPDRRALCTAENTSHTLHNILTLRGAQIRDARAWADYLTETIGLYGTEFDVVFASHHWPTWGRQQGVEFLETQRDLYSYLHDQTVRLMNRGLTGSEIAEIIELPPALEQSWHTHGYYGSVSHNVKGIYQRYLGWYDGNPANLWTHPPAAAAQRYVSAMGGPEATLSEAQRAFDDGDYRWAAEVLKHLLYAQRDHEAAAELQARTFEQLAYGSENGTWRNVYLAGAHELRHGIFGTPVSGEGVAANVSVEQVFAGLAVRVDGPRVWDERFTINWVFPDLDRVIATELRNGTLIQRPVSEPEPDTTTVTMTRATLIGVVTQTIDVTAALTDGSIRIDGDPGPVGTLLGALESPAADFPIVTGRPESAPR